MVTFPTNPAPGQVVYDPGPPEVAYRWAEEVASWVQIPLDQYGCLARCVDVDIDETVAIDGYFLKWSDATQRWIAAPGGGGGGGDFALVLTSNTTFYVDFAAGNNANDGLTPLTAWADLDYATQWMKNVKANGYIVDIICAAGTFTGSGLDLINVNFAPVLAANYRIWGANSFATILDGVGFWVTNGVRVELRGFTYANCNEVIRVEDDSIAVCHDSRIDGGNYYLFQAYSNSRIEAAYWQVAPTGFVYNTVFTAQNCSTINFVDFTFEAGAAVLDGQLYEVDGTSHVVNQGGRNPPCSSIGSDYSVKKANYNTNLYVRKYQGAVTISNGNPCVVTLANHGLLVAETITFSADPLPFDGGKFTNGTSNLNLLWSVEFSDLVVNDPIVFDTYDSVGKGLPAEITPGTTYYIKSLVGGVNGNRTVTISATPGGAAIVFSSTKFLDSTWAIAWSPRNAFPAGFNTGMGSLNPTGYPLCVHTVLDANTFTVSQTPYGPQIATSSAQSGQIFMFTGTNTDDGSSIYPVFDPQRAVEIVQSYDDFGGYDVYIIIERGGYYDTESFYQLPMVFPTNSIVEVTSKPKNCGSFNIHGYGGYNAELFRTTFYAAASYGAIAIGGRQMTDAVNGAGVDLITGIKIDGQYDPGGGLFAVGIGVYNSAVYLLRIKLANLTYGIVMTDGARGLSTGMTYIFFDPSYASNTFYPFQIIGGSQLGVYGYNTSFLGIDTAVSARGVDVKSFATVTGGSFLQIRTLPNISSLTNSGGGTKYTVGDLSRFYCAGIASLPGAAATVGTYAIAV